MDKVITINVFEQIGARVAVSSDDGDALFKRIDKAFEKDVNVVLNFDNISLITSTFLNAAIGQLYSGFEQKFIKEHLEVQGMVDDDLVLLKRVVGRAKDYFKNRERIEKGISESLIDD